MKKLEPTVHNLVILNNFKSEVIGYLKQHEDNGELDTTESFSKLFQFVDELSINDFSVLMAAFATIVVGKTALRMRDAIATGKVEELQKALKEVDG